MKRHLIFNTVFFLILFSTCSYALTLTKKVEWPSLPDDSIASDTSDKLVFHGFGDIIKIYNSDDLVLKSIMSLDTKTSILALNADEANNYIYCAAGISGIFIIDYNDPAAPHIISSIKDVANDPGFLLGEERGYINAASIKVNYPYLYVADHGYGLRIFNISQPNSPYYEGGYRQDGLADDLTTGGYVDLDHFTYNSKDYACVLDEFYGLRIFDVTKPSDYNNPEYETIDDLGEPDKDEIDPPDFTIPEKNDPDPVAQKDLRNDFYKSKAYVFDIKTRIIDGQWSALVTSISTIEEKAAVVKLELLDDSGNIRSTPLNKGRCSELLKGRSVDEKDYAFIADGNNGLNIVDVINPSSTNEKGVETYDIKAGINSGFDYSYSLKILENTLFLADFSKGLTSIDISSPLNPFEGKNTGEVFSLKNITIINNTLSLSSTSENDFGIYFFDIENPYEPKLIKRLETSSKPLGIESLTENIAAVTENKIIIYSDVSSTPAAVSELVITGTATDFAAKDNYLFTASGTAFNIYLYTETGVTLVKSLSAGKEINCIKIDKINNRLIAGTTDSIIFYDITDPANPILKGEHLLAADISNIFINSNILYAVTGATIYSLDIADLGNVININTIDAESSVNTLFADEDFLFAGIDKGVKIYSKTTGSSPEFLFTHSTKGNVSEIILKDSRLYSADSTGGFSISEYNKDAGSDPAPLESSSGTSSACFIKALF